METGGKAEKKKSLKWFLINRFLGMMLFIFVSEQLIGIFYNQIIIPGMSLMLQNLQISITASGKPTLLLVQMLLYLLASFLPGGFDGYVQQSISAQMENSLRIAVDSPLFMGGWGIALRLLIIALFLVLILVSVMPYLTGAFYYCRIVTKKVNELVEEEKEQQQEYDRRRNLLLSDIAHDIKTPITTLCSYSKALSEDVVQGKKKQEYLDAIYQKSMRMNELITLLFEYVKMDSSGFELHREDSDLAEILRESIAPLYSDFEEKKIELKVEIPETQMPCCVDKIQIMRAVTNLLTNAVRYGREGGKTLVQMDQYTITIADDGMEIDQEFAEHIFEPFSRADKARSTKGGSGLGLSIASKIIQMHGGKLELNREYGRGYTKAFRIMLREP
ncbi:MAG: HAMP domain-containing histidine kinase [Eubacterium sp.]|nr:HAMP domain-containing histidine kinase [Eubacterium sp.]